MQIAIVGAGISGLTAARLLHDQDHRVVVFEKSRGPGGRAATRRMDDLEFDHGAQYFTAREAGFRRAVTAWQKNGLVEIWQGCIGRVSRGRLEPSTGNQERFVGVPGMSAIGKHLAADLSVRAAIQVAPPQRIEGLWRLRSETGEALGDFDLAILAVPAPQARTLLLPSAPRFAEQAGAVVYSPTWALMLAFATDPLLPYDGLFIAGGEISWAARNSSKPGRPGHTWIVHATPEWTYANLERHREEVAEALKSALSEQTGINPAGVVAQAAHRWLYSLVDKPLEVGALWDPDIGLGVCGDWCNGARIEGAFLSGQAIAGRILGQLAGKG